MYQPFKPLSDKQKNEVHEIVLKNRQDKEEDKVLAVIIREASEEHVKDIKRVPTETAHQSLAQRILEETL
jgi:hypothetical protein